MKRQEIKDKIKTFFFKNTPNLENKIIEDCKKETQLSAPIYIENDIRPRLSLFKKTVIAFSVAVIFISGVTIGYFSSNRFQTNELDTNIYIDVNPSVELKLNDENEVYECVAINEEAENIIYDMDLTGTNVNIALHAIIGAMYVKGYLSPTSNSLLVSVKDVSSNTKEMLNYLTDEINTIFNGNDSMQCSIIAQEFKKNEELSNLADYYNISEGKMCLINKIIKSSEIYTETNIPELAKMSIKELDLIYQTLFNSLETPPENDVISGRPEGFVSKRDVLKLLLEYLSLSNEDIDWYEVVALYHHNDKEERKMVYLVSIKLNDESVIYRYIVDCETGEILPEETLDEWEIDFTHDNGNNPVPPKDDVPRRLILNQK